MYKTCSTEKSVQQQRLLAQSLLSIMLVTPYAEISVTALCEKANLSRKTFYRLFGCKDDVLCALIDHTLTDYFAFQPRDLPLLPGPQRDLQRFFAYWQLQKPLLDVLLKNRRTRLLNERFLTLVLQEHWSDRIPFHAPDPETRREQLIFFISGLLGCLLNWHQSGFDKTPTQMATTVFQMVRHLSPG